MYKGKHYKKTSGFFKSSILMVAVLAMVICIVGASVAFIIASTNDVVNKFTPSSVSCEVEETLNGSTKSNVSITNTGDTDAYIRAMVNITWKNEAGEVYGASQPVVDTDYTIDYADTSNTGWTKGADGFWYYNSVVAPSEKTGVLIETCTTKEGSTPPEGYFLSVEILADAIQENAVTDAWGYGPTI